MPYKFETDRKVIANPELDKRVKLTDEDRENIKKDYATGLISINGLARKYNVSKRTIQFILFPERKKKNAEQFKERRKDGRYYDKEKHKDYMKKHRQGKKKLDDLGLLTDKSEGGKELWKN